MVGMTKAEGLCGYTVSHLWLCVPFVPAETWCSQAALLGVTRCRKRGRGWAQPDWVNLGNHADWLLVACLSPGPSTPVPVSPAQIQCQWGWEARIVGGTGWFLLVKVALHCHCPLISLPHREDAREAENSTQVELCGSRRVKLTAKLCWAELVLWLVPHASVYCRTPILSLWCFKIPWGEGTGAMCFLVCSWPLSGLTLNAGNFPSGRMESQGLILSSRTRMGQATSWPPSPLVPSSSPSLWRKLMAAASPDCRTTS